MATLSDLADLSPDISIDELLKRFQPSDADMQEAKNHALLTAGLGMLGSSYLPPTMAAGRGGLLGVQSYNDEIKQAQTQRNQNVTAASAILPLLRQAQWSKTMQNVGTPQMVGGGWTCDKHPSGRPVNCPSY